MPFIDEIMGNRITEEIIDIFDNVEDPRQLEYLAVMIIDDKCDYNSEQIAEYAVKKGHAHRLGYLTDLALQSAKELNVGNIERAETMIKLLEKHIPSHFDRNNPKNYLTRSNPKNEWDRKMMRWNSRKVDERNLYWHVYSRPGGLDIKEVQRLYLIDSRKNVSGIVYHGPNKEVRIRI